MKILYTITKSEIGGAQVHVAHLARSMKDRGHAVAISAYPGGWLEYEATKLGVRFYPNPYFGNSFNPIKIIKSLFFIKKIVHDFSPDIVHCHSSFAGVITRLAIHLKLPTIFTAHSFAFTEGASFFRKILGIFTEKFMSKYASKIICVSHYDKKLALRYKITKPEKLTVIHNGVMGSNFSSNIKENTIVTIGRLAYPKDYMLLLEAYKLSNTEMNLKVISDGPMRSKIEQKIIDLNLKDRVVLLGDLIDQQEVFKELSLAKFFILISKHEGLPMSILEAMSSGLPVIASNVGGIKEQIDSSCGVLVSNNKEDIAEAIRLLDDNDLQRKMGDSSRKIFEEKFTLDVFIEKTENVYKEFING